MPFFIIKIKISIIFYNKHIYNMQINNKWIQDQNHCIIFLFKRKLNEYSYVKEIIVKIEIILDIKFNRNVIQQFKEKESQLLVNRTFEIGFMSYKLIKINFRCDPEIYY